MGDQGIVYGYATEETPELVPQPFMVATHALEILRMIDFPYLRPNAKAQVTFDYQKHHIEPPRQLPAQRKCAYGGAAYHH